MKTKNMKSLLLIFSVLFIFPLTSWSQGGGMGPGSQGRDREKMEAQRIAYLTKKMDLTPKEAEKFWPVYNQHHDEMKAKMDSVKDSRDLEPEEIANMSDKEAAEVLDNQIKNEQEMLQTKQEFLLSLKEILPERKVLMFLYAERGFRMEMMRSVAKRRPGGRNK